jgi:hypothetical protein
MLNVLQFQLKCPVAFIKQLDKRLVALKHHPRSRLIIIAKFATLSHECTFQSRLKQEQLKLIELRNRLDYLTQERYAESFGTEASRQIVQVKLGNGDEFLHRHFFDCFQNIGVSILDTLVKLLDDPIKLLIVCVACMQVLDGLDHEKDVEVVKLEGLALVPQHAVNYFFKEVQTWFGLN